MNVGTCVVDSVCPVEVEVSVAKIAVDDVVVEIMVMKSPDGGFSRHGEMLYVPVTKVVEALAGSKSVDDGILISVLLAKADMVRLGFFLGSEDFGSSLVFVI